MMLLPPQVTSVPLYVMWSQLGLTGTLWPLILPNLLGDAFSIFLLRQFFLTIPKEYTEAARLDGCGELRTLLRVIVPMAKPGIAATAIFKSSLAHGLLTLPPVPLVPPARPIGADAHAGDLACFSPPCSGLVGRLFLPRIGRR